MPSKVPRPALGSISRILMAIQNGPALDCSTLLNRYAFAGKPSPFSGLPSHRGMKIIGYMVLVEEHPSTGPLSNRLPGRPYHPVETRLQLRKTRLDLQRSNWSHRCSLLLRALCAEPESPLALLTWSGHEVLA